MGMGACGAVEVNSLSVKLKWAYNTEPDAWGHHTTSSWYASRPYLRAAVYSIAMAIPIAIGVGMRWEVDYR